MLPEDKLKMIQSRSEELEATMSGEMGEVAPDDFVRMSREYAEIKPLVESIQKFQATRDELSGLQEMLDSPDIDAEMKEMAELEQEELKALLPDLEHSIKLQLLPKDDADEKNAISRVIFTGCINDMRRVRAGAARLCLYRNRILVVSRK